MLSFQVFTNALTSLPSHARQSLSDLRILPQREDLAKKISGLHATFSCSSGLDRREEDDDGDGDSGNGSGGGSGSGGSNASNSSRGNWKARRKRKMEGGWCGGCLARLASAATGGAAGGGGLGGVRRGVGGVFRVGGRAPPEITHPAAAVQSVLEPALPMPDEEELDKRFAELVVSQRTERIKKKTKTYQFRLFLIIFLSSTWDKQAAISLPSTATKVFNLLMLQPSNLNSPLPLLNKDR